MTGLFAVTDESPGRAGDTTSFNDYGKNVCLLPFCLSAACLIFSHVDLLVWADLESPVVDFFYFFFLHHCFIALHSAYFFYYRTGLLHMTRRHHLWMLMVCLHDWELGKRDLLLDSFGY